MYIEQSKRKSKQIFVILVVTLFFVNGTFLFSNPFFKAAVNKTYYNFTVPKCPIPSPKAAFSLEDALFLE